MLAGIVFFLLGVGYVWVNEGKYDMLVVQGLFGYTALVLISTGLSLPSIAFFFRRFENLVPYRRYAGAVGLMYGGAFLLTALGIQSVPELFTAGGERALFFIAGMVGYMIGFSYLLRWGAALLVRWGKVEWETVYMMGYVFILIMIAYLSYREAEVWFLTWFDKAVILLPPLSLPVVLWMIVMVGVRLHKGKAESVKLKA